MPPALRLADPTSHPGVVAGPGVATVLIGGMPAAVLGDLHVCSFPPPAVHPPSPFVTGSATVLIGGRPALRVGDMAACGAVGLIGALTVLIGG
jgi:uncharacterized Zn-binding protein involved in type VI secretion